MKRLLLVVALLVTVTTGVPAAQAITNGVPDNGEHPYVGQLLFYVPDEEDPRFTDPGAWFNCSGTLISPTVVLTAGHCTFGVGKDSVATSKTGGRGGNDVWVTFSEEADYEGLPPSSTFVPDRNEDRYLAWEAWLDANPEWVRGTAYPHPSYNPDAFFLFDLGVVILDEPVGDLGTGEDVGELPELGFLDRYLKKGKNADLFTAVGYGLNKVLPFASEGGDVRFQATTKIVNMNGTFGVPDNTAIVFSNNKGKPHTGGTCFGDSGGPVFLEGTNLVVAVTSFGVSPNCTGTDGAYRVDQSDDLDWLADVLAGDP